MGASSHIRSTYSRNGACLPLFLLHFLPLTPSSGGFYPFLDWDTSRCLIPLVDEASGLGLEHPTLLLRCEKEVLEEYRLERQDEATAVEELLDLSANSRSFFLMRWAIPSTLNQDGRRSLLLPGMDWEGEGRLFSESSKIIEPEPEALSSKSARRPHSNHLSVCTCDTRRGD